MGVIAKGIPRGYQGLFTTESLRYSQTLKSKHNQFIEKDEFAQWKNLEIFHVFCYVWYKYLNF